MSNQELTELLVKQLNDALSTIDKLIWRGCSQEIKLAWIDLFDVKCRIEHKTE
jgi:hypothetical protein